MLKSLNGEINLDFNFRLSGFNSYNNQEKNNLHLPCAQTKWGKQKFVSTIGVEYKGAKGLQPPEK